MFIRIYDNNLDNKTLETIIKSLESDKVCIFFTDTLYCFVCDVNSKKASEHLAQLKGKKLQKSNFSFLCSSLSMATNYIKPITNKQFAFIKDIPQELFTFIFNANNQVAKIFQNKKRTIGIRLVKNQTIKTIIETLNRPLLVSTITHQTDENEIYMNDEEIYDIYSNNIDIMLSKGDITTLQTTVLDLTQNDSYEVLRYGAGII